MKKSIALIVSAIAIAVVSALFGAAIMFMFLATPMDESASEFTGNYLSMQSDALHALRLGENEPALLYLETVSSYSLNELNKQKSRDPDTPTPLNATKAI